MNNITIGDPWTIYEDSGLFAITNGSEAKLYINNKGKIGIGTNTPSDKLEVAGAVVRQGFFQARSEENITVGNTALAVNLTAEDRKDGDYYIHSASSPANITVKEDGWYKISYTINWYDSSPSDQNVVRAWLEVNGNPAPATMSSAYIYGEFASTSATTLLNLSGGDVIQIKVIMVGSGNVHMVENQTWITIEKV